MYALEMMVMMMMMMVMMVNMLLYPSVTALHLRAAGQDGVPGVGPEPAAVREQQTASVHPQVSQQILHQVPRQRRHRLQEVPHQVQVSPR